MTEQEKRIAELEHFVKSFLDPDAFGWAVTKEVRDRARWVLRLPAIERPPTQDRK
ncbi:MAG: hypothetical protein NT086_09040 [Proteobacteria bacterium]|nr:hypothetical protein [Pseudomonadota bacterium]